MDLGLRFFFIPWFTGIICGLLGLSALAGLQQRYDVPVYIAGWFGIAGYAVGYLGATWLLVTLDKS